MCSTYTYCISRRHFFGGKQLWILLRSHRATRCAIIHGARGDQRGRAISTTPPSAARAARCTAQAPSRDQGHPGGAHEQRNDPIDSPCYGMRCPPVHVFSPPGHGFSTLDARWKLLI